MEEKKWPIPALKVEVNENGEEILVETQEFKDFKKQRANRNNYWTEYKRTHYSRVVVEVSPETKEKWQAAANIEDKSLGKFIKDIVNEYIGRQD